MHILKLKYIQILLFCYIVASSPGEVRGPKGQPNYTMLVSEILPRPVLFLTITILSCDFNHS